MSSGEALAFSLTLLVAGSIYLAALVNWTSLLWALATWALYVLAYTPLKTASPANTAVGAVAGALPVLIGWTATGAAIDARALALVLVLFLWQFPHFMAIAWIYRGQYAAAGMRMLTVVDPTGLRAAGQSLAAAILLVPAAMVLAVPSGSIEMFLSAAVAGTLYLVATVRFAVRRDDVSARFLVLSSLGALFGLLAAAAVFGGPA
jgi:protoheme IX farnesyltransferase